ncbi:MAG: hypothetical protein ACLFP4_12140 [Spirochaetales bacterium]
MKVDDGHPSCEALDPGYHVGPALLHPCRVDLCLEELGVRLVVEDLEPGLLAVPLELEGVVMVGELDVVFGELAACLGEDSRELRVAER